MASRKQGGSVAAAEARERGGAAAGAAAAAVAAKVGNAPVQVVEELLSENERLRLIIQDMSEEVGAFRGGRREEVVCLFDVPGRCRSRGGRQLLQIYSLFFLQALDVGDFGVVERLQIVPLDTL